MDDDFDIDDDVLAAVGEQADRDIEAKKPQTQHLLCLKAEFGHSAFRPNQWEIIRSIIMEKRDNCVIMPTGYGKSLCFQFPSVFANGITVVVSPLISLMQDQVLSLGVANIPACFLGSAQKQRIEQNVIDGEFRLVYASPEYITAHCGQYLLEQIGHRLTLIAIDEAHAVSQWGHDFRTDFRRLGLIRTIVPHVPILAVTATATPHVQEDIVKVLKLRNPQMLCTGFDRPNIEFIVGSKSENQWTDLKPYMTNVKGSVIIYVLKRALAEEIATLLQSHDIECDYYHAKMTPKRRKQVLEDFIRDRLKIIVATVAFGMGIDKPDVRCVIHYGASKNIETYYQEIGRAGRDGFPSKAVTFFDNTDFSLHEWFLNQNIERKSQKVIDHLRQLGQKVKEYFFTKKCRRKFLLEYFGSSTKHLKPRQKCCDNCAYGKSSIKISDTYAEVDDEGYHDFTTDALLLLKAVQLTNSTSVAVNVLKGSGDKKAYEFRRSELYDAGKLMQKNYWTALVQQLKNDNLICLKKLQPPYKSKLIISIDGERWMKTNPTKSLVLKAIPEMYDFFKKKRKVTLMNKSNSTNYGTGESSGEAPVAIAAAAVEFSNGAKQVEEEINEIKLDDNHLEHILYTVRSELAERNGCAPFAVASNAAIKQMVETKPISMKEFSAAIIDGFSVAKIQKFAESFVRTVSMFMNNELSFDGILRKFPMKSQKPQLTTADQRKLLQNIHKKKSISELASLLNVSSDQIVNETIILIKSGQNINKVHLIHLCNITEDIFEFIKAHVSKDDLQGSEDIPSIMAKCDNKHKKINDVMIRLVISYLKLRSYVDILQIPYYDPDAEILMKANLIFENTLLTVGDPMKNCPMGTRAFLDQFQCNTGTVIKTKESATDEDSDLFEDPTFDRYLATMDFEFLESSEEQTQGNGKEKENIPSSATKNITSLAASSSHHGVQCSKSKSQIIDQRPNNFPSKSLAKPVASAMDKQPLKTTKPLVKHIQPRVVSKVIYISDSDSDSDEKKNTGNNDRLVVESKFPPAQKRPLPEWMSTDRTAKDLILERIYEDRNKLK